MAKLPVAVRVLRSYTRTGLIRARLIGAKEARGAVLTFLDAHCEATEGEMKECIHSAVCLSVCLSKFPSTSIYLLLSRLYHSFCFLRMVGAAAVTHRRGQDACDVSYY